MKYLALIVCAAALLTTGCKCCHKSCDADSCHASQSACCKHCTPACGHAECAKADCAKCPNCSAK